MSLYSQSSCNCNECKNCNQTFESPSLSCDNTTNMFVRNCEFPNDCTNNSIFKHTIEPTNEYGFTILNPLVLSEPNTNDYKKTSNGTYSSNDPRLFHGAHVQRLTLDKPPEYNKVTSETIYSDKKLEKYGKQYKSYSDIASGQIVYYVDKSIQDTLYNPNFPDKANVIGQLYIDPMGGIKPQYTRVPLKQDNVLNTKCRDQRECLSFIQDTQNHRQDIMSMQMRKYNSQRWTPRWTNNNFIN